MPPARMLLHMVLGLAETLARRVSGRARRKAWPFVFEVIVAMLRRNFMYSASLPIDAARRFNDACGRAQPSRHAVDRTRTTLGGVPVERFVPREVPSDGVLVYLHGGSYLMGSATTHADLIARLAVSGFEVIAVEYRLAPEHTVMEAVDDVCAVYRALLAENAGTAIALAGDSAGGGLAFLVAIALRDAGDALPAAIATIAPWVDLRCTGASFAENERTDWGTAELLRAQARLAAQDVALDDPRLSPAFADLHGLPPALVHAGEAEIVRDAVVAFGEALSAAGVDAQTKVWPDMVHDFHLLAEYHPSARQAIDELADFLREHASTRAV